MLSYLKEVGANIIQSLPHYKFQRKIQLTELLGDLCLTRSKLNVEILEYSNIVDKLTSAYNSTLHISQLRQSNIDFLNNLVDETSIISEEVNNLLSKNSFLTNKVIKLNKKEFVSNPDIKRGIDISINKAEIIDKKFKELSSNIFKLNLSKTA